MGLVKVGVINKSLKLQYYQMGDTYA
jgi:hypothetical protein